MLHRIVLLFSEESDAALFDAFLAKHSKIYAGDSREYQRRFQVFQENLKTIAHLQKNELGTARYGVTEFADLTPSEFEERYLSPAWKKPETPAKQAKIPDMEVPTSYDWRDHGAVTAVKNQGSCGSCWAFSVTGNIEGQWFLKKNKLISLSEQELVDCDKIDQGCNGGLPLDAYKEIMRIGGLEDENDYPYAGRDQKCTFNKADVKVYINDSVQISEDETKMAAWMVANGPMSIGINAAGMQFYFGGISHPYRFLCSPSQLNHGVLIVGYGVKNSTPYWIVKNSWGKGWGESGYYLVYRGDGTCGLNKMVTSAIVK